MKTTIGFENALAFAVALHRHQFRKGGELPYIGHLLGVCAIALENGADEDEAIAALLHDSIEDQAENFGGTDKLRKHIRAEFGEKVLAIVEGCTDADTFPKPPWRERKERYVGAFGRGVRLGAAGFGCRQASTTPGRSFRISGRWETSCGRGSPVAGKARCGTTGRLSERSRRMGVRRCAANWSAFVHDLETLAGPVEVAR